MFKNKLLLILFLFVITNISYAASKPSFIPSLTRYVQLFGNLENQLNEAIVTGNRKKIDNMLEFNFEERSAKNPGKIIARDSWIDTSLTTVKTAPKISQMAAREFQDAVVVSFNQNVTNNNFIIDVWKGSGDDWKLAARYRF